jgi:methyl-accepting chemotaxis protein
VTQQNAAMVEQASAVSASMEDQAATLALAVSKFRLRRGRTAAGPDSTGRGAPALSYPAALRVVAQPK